MTLKFGIWSPVCGDWLRIVHAQKTFPVQCLVDIAVQADHLGYDFYYIPEHYLNAVHGANDEVLDAWIVAIATSFNTKRIGSSGSGVKTV
jgi:dimethylsulfone monooxygenase